VIGAYPTPLEFSVAELNYNHKDRAETLVGVTKYLMKVQSGCRGLSEISRLKEWAETAKPSDSYLMGVRDLGYPVPILRILLGAQAVKPDVHIRRFVSEAVGHTVSDYQALELFERLEGISTATHPLDYAIWERYARGT